MDNIDRVLVYLYTAYCIIHAALSNKCTATESLHHKTIPSVPHRELRSERNHISLEKILRYFI